jgi:hypothetical protein
VTLFNYSKLAVMSTRPPIPRVPAIFSGVKRPERNVNHSAPSSAEVKNEWRYNRVPSM